MLFTMIFFYGSSLICKKEYNMLTQKYTVFQQQMLNDTKCVLTIVTVLWLIKAQYKLFPSNKKHWLKKILMNSERPSEEISVKVDIVNVFSELTVSSASLLRTGHPLLPELWQQPLTNLLFTIISLPILAHFLFIIYPFLY